MHPLLVQVRTDQRYAFYPRLAVSLALAVCLFGHLPVGTGAMDVLTGSPLFRLLACTVCVVGSALACALALVGTWRQGRSNIFFAASALMLCSLCIL